MVAPKWKERSRADDFVKMIVVRDPLYRCVSAYMDKFCGKDVTKPWAQDVINSAGTNGTLSFSEFLTYLETHDLASVDGHWRRQTALVDFYGAENVHTVRIEQVAADLEQVPHAAVAKNAGAMMKVNANARVSTTSDPFPIDGSELVKMSNTAIIAYCKAHEIALPKTDNFLNANTINRIKAAYHEDYTFLPYE